jgi:hypothetical protein
MTKINDENPWLWVVIQNPGENEQLLGQHDEKNGVSFIPSFREKDTALLCLRQLAHEPNEKYEVQAIHYKQLARQVAEDGFLIFVLNEKGEVIEKIEP